MNMLVRILLSCFLLFLFPATVFAHGADQPPYLKVNNVYTLLYTVYGSSVDELAVPQDIGADTYLVNTAIQFTLTPETLPVPQDSIEDLVFLWDFGDGTRGEGMYVAHTYSKPGSYIQTLHVSYPADWNIPEPMLLQSTLLHVVSDKKYKLPTSKIFVNGEVTDDPLLDVLEFPLSQELIFDASQSTSESPIISYFWDMGNGETVKRTDAKHTYKYDVSKYEYGLPTAFVVLRVINKDGFIADSYVQINNTDAKGGKKEQASLQRKSNALWYAIGVVLVGGCIILFVLLKTKKDKYTK